MRHIDTNAFYFVKAHKHQLTKQQYRTLRGQVLAGDGAGAVKGVKTLLARKREVKANGANIDGSI